MLPYCNPLLRALLYPEMQGMERMKTYGNSMIEMLLLFPGTVSSPMIELPCGRVIMGALGSCQVSFLLT